MRRLAATTRSAGLLPGHAGGGKRCARTPAKTARDIPAIGRAIVTAARLVRRSRGGAGAASPLPTTQPALTAGADEPITVPTATIFIDADEWEARAHSLGGTSNALLVALAARFAQRVGRVTADGSVAVRMPVNERATADTRANAVRPVYITVDPALATTDLREIRAAVKQALIRHREMPDEERAMLALVPLVPRRLFRRMASVTASVLSSNLGVINPAAIRPDGTDADYFAVKLRYSDVTQAMVYRLGGLLVLDSGRACGQVFVSVIAYQPGRLNSNDSLRQYLSSVLNDFSLTGKYL
jgi:diacylglycerol O-acyltransferase